MQKTNYTEKPEALLLDEQRGKVCFTISVNIEQREDGSWKADTRSYWVDAGEVNPEAVRQNPEYWLWYDLRKAARAEAQRLVDELRNGCPVAPVPSFRPGAAVCNRASDKVMLLAGLQMGGLPMFELADGSITPLTAEDLQAIMRDIAAWEMAVQGAKQACWGAIDAATSEQQMEDALATLAEELKQ